MRWMAWAVGIMWTFILAAWAWLILYCHQIPLVDIGKACQ